MDMNVRSLNGERDGFTINFDPVDLACDSGVLRRGRLRDPGNGRGRHRSQHRFALLGRDPGRRRVAGRPTPGRRPARHLPRPRARPRGHLHLGPRQLRLLQSRARACCAPEFAPGKRYFRGIELSGQKRLSDCWMMYASYMYSSPQGQLRRLVPGDRRLLRPQPEHHRRLRLSRVPGQRLRPADARPPAPGQAADGVRFPVRPDDVARPATTRAARRCRAIGWWDAYIGPEIFITQRGSEGRSPDTYEIDLQADYGLRLGPVTVHFLASLFNAAQPAADPAGGPGLGASRRAKTSCPSRRTSTTASATSGSSRERCAWACASASRRGHGQVRLSALPADEALGRPRGICWRALHVE